MRFPGTAPLFLLWLSNPVRIVKEATPAALGSRPAPMRHHLCLPRSSTAVLGAGGERGHRSGAARTAPVPGTPSPAPLPGTVYPGLGPGGRRHTWYLWLKFHWRRGEAEGAEVFALSVSTLLGTVMPRWQRREGRGIELLCSALRKQGRESGQSERRSRRFSHAAAHSPLTSIAQRFFPQQAAPGHCRSPHGGPLAAHPIPSPTDGIRAAAEPSPHPGEKFPHGCPQAAPSWGGRASTVLTSATAGGCTTAQRAALAGEFTAHRLLCLVSRRSSSSIPTCSPAPSPVFTPSALTSPWDGAKAWPSWGEPHR